MSSDRALIVAFNHTNGVYELPLGPRLAQYTKADAESLMQKVRRQYADNWMLAVYMPVSDWYAGAEGEAT